MALALANASALKPDIKLEQALDDYRKVLSDKEREQLDKEKEQLRAQGKPYTEAALNFTTLIDRECNSHRRRCMGTRLITFLQSVEQFSGVVDTFVSSHPEFAALVWGGVKLALRVDSLLLMSRACLIITGCKQLLVLLRSIVDPSNEHGKAMSANQYTKLSVSFRWFEKSTV